MRKCCLVTYALFPSSRSLASSEDNDERNEVVAVSSVATSKPKLARPTSNKPLRKSSTLKLDVRYVLDDVAPCESRNLHQLPSTSTSMAVYSSEPPTLMPEPSYRSLPPKVSVGSCCIIPNFDSVPYRELRSGETTNIDLSNLCDGQDSKNWRSIGKQHTRLHQQTSTSLGGSSGLRRADFEASLAPTASPRSSDSGMADSFQYHSAELSSCYAKFCQSAAMHSESENDENKFENQCICTSPFGSTPRQSSSSESSPSACKSLLSSRLMSNERQPKSEEVLNSSEDEVDDSSEEEEFENCTCKLMDENEEEDEDQEGEEGEEEEVTPVEPERSFTKLTLIQQKHLTQPLMCEKKVKSRRGRKPVARKIHKEEAEADAGGGQVFTSGLYAHWWLKKTIPMTDQVKQSEFEASSSRSGALLVPRD